MSTHIEDIEQLIAKIRETPVEKRRIYQHQLDHVLLCLRVEGKPIPEDLAQISENLRREILEDEFDNMPI